MVTTMTMMVIIHHVSAVLAIHPGVMVITARSTIRSGLIPGMAPTDIHAQA